MENLPQYYTVLFNAVTDALHLLERATWAARRGCSSGASSRRRRRTSPGSRTRAGEGRMRAGPPVRTTHRKFRIAL